MDKAPIHPHARGDSCSEDVAFRVIAANHVPDHTTIARFRQVHEQALDACFIETLKLSRAAGLVRAGLLALDGTKLQAAASLEAKRTLLAIEEEVARMLAEAAQADATDDECFAAKRRGRSAHHAQPHREPPHRARACGRYRRETVATASLAGYNALSTL